MNDPNDFETRETLSSITPGGVMPREFVPPEPTPEPTFKPSPDIHRDLEESWERPDDFAKTGFRGLDAILRGGLRRGECVALAGSAGQGKSSLAIQLALEAARSGGVAIYCTVEMPREEILARAIAREMFTLADATGRNWAVGFGDVLFGHHLRGTITSTEMQTEVMGRYLRAREALHRDVYPRFIVQQLQPGATIGDVAELVANVRANLSFEGLVVLVLDPLQRLFASPSGARQGRALEAVNANETERVGAVVQELKHLADAQNLAAVFTSDTTKAAVMGDAKGDGLELRGSYQLAHLATVILTMRASEDAEGLAKANLHAGLEGAQIERAAPSWLRTRDDATKLGARYALLHCAKARRGPPSSFAMGFVPGAGAFVEGDADDAGASPSKGKKPTKTKPTKTKPVNIVVKLNPMDSKRLADAAIAEHTKPTEETDQ